MLHVANVLSSVRRVFGLLVAQASSVGGQAVMEGVMMRNADTLAIAVRKCDNSIYVETWPWFSITDRFPWVKKPFLRGFPVLVETLVNGIKALNFSAVQAADEPEAQGDGGLKTWHLVLTLVMSVGLALGLFVVVPHLFSLGMESLGLGSDMDGISFHIWDGVFKLAIFLGYIVAISFVPDIRRVFQYHGAEHKVIWAHEKGGAMTPSSAKAFSRLHPRCGTTFLLFVLSLSIVLHTVLVPLILQIYDPGGSILRHVYILGVKLLLMVPISCVAYELIKFAGARPGNPFCRVLSGPGLVLQNLTTHEPDETQLEVALAALEAALGTSTEDAVEVEAFRNEDAECLAQGANVAGSA